MRSVDASGYVKSGTNFYELLDAYVEEIGEENVVQVIIDNGSNYVAVGKTLTLSIMLLLFSLKVIKSKRMLIRMLN